MSLDGVIDAPTWTFDYGFHPRMGEAIGAVTERSRGILLGRTTFEMFEPAWSKRTVEDDPGAPFFNDTTTTGRRARDSAPSHGGPSPTKSSLSPGASAPGARSGWRSAPTRSPTTPTRRPSPKPSRCLPVAAPALSTPGP